MVEGVILRVIPFNLIILIEWVVLTIIPFNLLFSGVSCLGNNALGKSVQSEVCTLPDSQYTDDL